METLSKPKAFSYLRFSTPEQQRGDSYRRQTSMAEAYALQHGLDIDTSLTFHDLGISAYRGKNAEAGRLADFLEAVRAGLVPKGSVLLVEALDRLSRLVPRKALKVLESIIEEGITVVTLNDGKSYDEESIDHDPMNLMMAVVLFMRANEESATKARRLKAAWDGKRAKASEVPLTACCPAWLDYNRKTKTFSLIENRAVIVRRIFADTLNGVGFESIARKLNIDGVPTFGRAAHWHRTYIKKILENPAVIGTFVPHIIIYEDGFERRKPLKPVHGYYPAAIDDETYLRVQSLRGSSIRPKVKGSASVNSLFAGLAKCPLCGSTMTRVMKGTQAKAGKPYLVCSKAKAGAGCQYHGVRQEDIEQALIDNAALITGTVPSGLLNLDSARENLEISLGVVSEQIQNILEAIAIRPSPSLTSKLRELEDEHERMLKEHQDLITQLAESSSPLVGKKLSDLNQLLQSTPIDRTKTNAALRQVFSTVIPDWRSGTLILNWKQGGEAARVMYAWPEESP